MLGGRKGLDPSGHLALRYTKASCKEDWRGCVSHDKHHLTNQIILATWVINRSRGLFLSILQSLKRIDLVTEKLSFIHVGLDLDSFLYCNSSLLKEISNTTANVWFIL